MVTALTHDDTALVNEALTNAHRVTSAKISVVARPASATYDGMVLVFGLFLGTSLAIAAWCFDFVVSVPWLFCLQLSIITCLDILHHRSSLLMGLVPKKLGTRRAHHEAFRAYSILQAHAKPGEPFVLLFISRAERYVQVITNPTVHNVVPDDWHLVTEGFARDVRPNGLGISCQNAVAHIALHLAPSFPPKDPPHAS